MKRALRWVALAVPYVVVPIGLYGLRSGWAAMVLYHVAMLLMGGGIDGTRHVGSLLRGRAGGMEPALLFAFGCLAAGPVLWFAWPYLGSVADLRASLGALGLTHGSVMAFAVYYTLVNPLIEEWYWRGVLGRPTARRAARCKPGRPRPRPAIGRTVSHAPTLGDAAFAGYHIIVLIAFVPWPWALWLAVVLAGAGWAWRQLAERHGGLAIPVLTHALADLSVILAADAIVRGAG